MSTDAKYVIAAGTVVDLQNKATGRKVTGYRTKRELTFAHRTNTGWGYSVWYFTYEKWVIAVNAKDVV